MQHSHEQSLYDGMSKSIQTKKAFMPERYTGSTSQACKRCSRMDCKDGSKKRKPIPQEKEEIKRQKEKRVFKNFNKSKRTKKLHLANDISRLGSMMNNHHTLVPLCPFHPIPFNDIKAALLGQNEAATRKISLANSLKLQDDKKEVLLNQVNAMALVEFYGDIMFRRASFANHTGQQKLDTEMKDIFVGEGSKYSSGVAKSDIRTSENNTVMTPTDIAMNR
ncbi:uncharacterized protein BX664DRAFT_349827 [Halteromyces radiatus]|uniref:uncharacterized protein n=1 Tax=Halteromyces radiatus TaxID=101107 RepID=UPI00221F763E|nr:uncharacterized protein BX664DRAFT_349827 [Halteromyces radiatus]KAI8089432.1 hypothetical protein BX664DRAFT_349827 [Halteromyces radiatus]